MTSMSELMHLRIIHVSILGVPESRIAAHQYSDLPGPVYTVGSSWVLSRYLDRSKKVLGSKGDIHASTVTRVYHFGSKVLI